MNFGEWLSRPWPWYVAGPLIGLVVPLLLLLGNKSFGISSSLRHICAACFPSDIPFFKYNWRQHSWNLFFVAGVFIGGMMVALFMANPNPVDLNPEVVDHLRKNGIENFSSLMPVEIFNWRNVLSLQGFAFIILGGFLVGFGTRYAGGCTSGHSIMGLANLQWPSLVATCCFMAGGFLFANLVVPYLLRLP